MKSRIALAALCGPLFLSACVTAPADPLVYVRTDGQRGVGNPALEQQFKIDMAICNGESQKSAVGMPPVYYDDSLAGAIDAMQTRRARSSGLTQIQEGCMAQKGYVHVPQSQAAATAASLAATAKARSEKPTL